MSDSNDGITPNATSSQPQSDAAGAFGSQPPQLPPAPAVPGSTSQASGSGAHQAFAGTAASSDSPTSNTNNRESQIGNQVVGNGTVTINNSGMTLEAVSWVVEKVRTTEEEKRSLEEKVYQRISRNFEERIKGLVGTIISDGEYTRRRATRQTGPLLIPKQDLPKTEEEYAVYFEQLGYEEKLFVAVLRLFPGIGWIDYWEIYRQAHTLIIPKLTGQSGKRKGGKAGPEYQPPYLRSELYWERTAHAVVSQAPQTFHEGTTSPTTVDFLPEVRPLVEQALSTRHRNWLFELAPLLYALGHHPYNVIRRMAAEAAAILANIDWDYVRRTIIEPWSKDESTDTRAAVGYTLNAVIRAGVNDGYAVYLLNRWSNPVGSFFWRQCWTATATHKLVGFERYELAAKDLGYIAGLADSMLKKYGKSNVPLPPDTLARLEVVDVELMDEVPPAVSFALVYLALEGKTREVIGTLKEWAAAPQEKGSWRIFWDMIIFNTLYDIGEGAFALRKDKVERQEDFFALLEHNQEFRRCLADVFCYLYRKSPENRRVVIEVLQNWVEHLDELKLNTEPVTKMIKRLFRCLNDHRTQGQNRDRLLRAMQRWTNHKHPAVRAVGQIVVQTILGTPPLLTGPANPPTDPPSDGRIVFRKP